MIDIHRPDRGVTPGPRISYAIARLQQLVLTAVTEQVVPFGLTALQFTTLSVLGRHGTPLSNSQLARRSFMTPQSMHEVIHRLESEGLIKRAPHPEHRRKLPASLTPKGRRVLVACEQAIAGFESRMLRGFRPADRLAFMQMLTSAVRNLDGGFTDLDVVDPETAAAPSAVVAPPRAAPQARPRRGRAASSG